MLSRCLSGRKLKECGVFEGFSEESGGALRLAKDRQEAYFVSCIYDSGENEMQWNSLILTISGGMVFRAHVWLFDSRADGELVDKLPFVNQQYEYIEKCAQYHSDYRQMLLYGKAQGRGRFARIAMAVFRQDDEGDRTFLGYDLSFPKESFTRYLPAIYRENLRLERFLAVQQSIYLDRERCIDTLAEKMDYANCYRGQLEKLARWVGWGELVMQVDDATLRALLHTGTSLISRKGTCSYYKELVAILTGKKAVIVEEPEKCAVTILVLEKPAAGREKGLNWLRQNNLPIGMDVKILVLEKTDRLDGMFLLDHAAMLSVYESELMTDGIDIEKIRLL